MESQLLLRSGVTHVLRGMMTHVHQKKYLNRQLDPGGGKNLKVNGHVRLVKGKGIS